MKSLMNFDEQDRQLRSWWHGLLARALDRLEACPTISWPAVALPILYVKSHQVWLVSVVVVVVGLGGFPLGRSNAQPAPSPPLQVNLVLNKLMYTLGTDPDPMGLAITIENIGAANIITAKGFRTQPFYLTLTFTDPDGHWLTLFGPR